MLRTHRPRITMVTRHCCIRVSKEAIVLSQMGYDLHLLTHKWPHYADAFKTVTLYKETSQFFQSVKLLAPYTDIFHCHNEPNWFVSQIKAVSDVPVILDVHDSFLVRVNPEDTTRTRVSVNERDNMRLADGLVFVCDKMTEIVKRDFKLDQPYAMVPSACPRMMYRYDAFEHKPGVVMHGRVDDIAKMEDAREKEAFEYCDYHDLCEQFMQAGIGFYLYPGGYHYAAESYKDLCNLQETMRIDKLIRSLGRFDWGFCGNSRSYPEWELGLPNKMFEYIAGGIPVVCWNAGHTAEFVKSRSMGIEIQSLDELKERWDEHIELRKNVVKGGRHVAMENYIEPLEELYEEVTHGSG